MAHPQLLQRQNLLANWSDEGLIGEGGEVGRGGEEALPWGKVSNSQEPPLLICLPGPPRASGPYQGVEEILCSVQTRSFLCGGPSPRQRQAEV